MTANLQSWAAFYFHLLYPTRSFCAIFHAALPGSYKLTFHSWTPRAESPDLRFLWKSPLDELRESEQEWANLLGRAPPNALATTELTLVSSLTTKTRTKSILAGRLWHSGQGLEHGGTVCGVLKDHPHSHFCILLQKYLADGLGTFAGLWQLNKSYSRQVKAATSLP